ncbi:tetratricopeptide repeat protein [Pseudochryseolinea flava]|uniref:Signal transduction histidine kinase internal region domain-containing protein n=1 Tax=Pseudochryseolinea flava TaxID=2059302 RepID=A0A364Y055_9BACT|nr:tetratricopeptide repeat protein [Pseudochryseolinea flava]RAV99980.1 hypothetical protein DQQ10_15590 [Pseudochryseolinea flava]
MRYVIFIMLAVGFSTTLQAQLKLDSLLNLLRNNPKETDKSTIYGRIAWVYIAKGNYDVARRYADSVLDVSTKLDDSVGIYRAHYYYGVIGRYTGEHASALDYLGNYLRFHASRGDSSRVAGALFQIGVVHSHYGNYEKSLAAHQRSLRIEEDAKNAYSVGNTLNSIGTIYKETKSYDLAILNLRKSLVIFGTLQEWSDMTNALVNLGNTYSELNEFDSAMSYYRRAIEIDKRIDKQRGVAVSYANIAFLFDRMGEFDSALVYHHKGLAIREKFTDAEDLTRSLIGVGRGYIKLGRYKEAGPYLSRALELSTHTNSKPLLRDVHMNFAEMFEGMKDERNALKHIKQFQIYKDSIFNDETQRKITELGVKHQLSDKVKHIALLEKEKQIQQQQAAREATIKNALIVGSILIAILAGAAVYAFRQRLLLVSKDKEIQEVNLRHQLSELKIKALRAQINPHFMFNCLNSINRMIVRGDNENASIYLKKFSKLLRLIVENGEENRVSLDNELTLIESYIQLEELRFKNKIGYEISIDEGIARESTFLPPMILQPFVENSIWHGLMNKKDDEAGKIKIAVREEDETLLCMIEDNGVGRDKSREFKEDIPGKTHSVGINITEERLKLISRERLNQWIKIVDLRDGGNEAIGTRVEIRIPLS